jgi:hypothetical protein
MKLAVAASMLAVKVSGSPKLVAAVEPTVTPFLPEIS